MVLFAVVSFFFAFCVVCVALVFWVASLDVPYGPPVPPQTAAELLPQRVVQVQVEVPVERVVERVVKHVVEVRGWARGAGAQGRVFAFAAVANAQTVALSQFHSTRGEHLVWEMGAEASMSQNTEKK